MASHLGDQSSADLTAGGAEHGTARAWQVGQTVVPTVSDAATARLARLEARLAVYAQYAAVVAEQAAAVVDGDEGRVAALAPARNAAAEHFAELRATAEAGADTAQGAFPGLLAEAMVEGVHQDAIDLALRARVESLRLVAARAARGRSAPRLSAGAGGRDGEVIAPASSSAARLDVRF